MENKILITYASKYGSTLKIAEKIKEVLEEQKLQVDLISVEEVNGIKPYSAVIIGSAVYMGQWRKKASAFLKNKASELSMKKAWIFSTGPTDKGDPVELLKGWKIPDNLKSVADKINPVEIKVFHGNLDLEKLSFMEKFIIKKVKAPVGDFIDWEDVENWAKGIADQLN
jgi:menaquinone-dependent protoporphyrinogen oxidase